MATTRHLFRPRSEPISGTMKAAPKSAPTLIRGLTRQIDLTDWRAAMDTTRQQSGGFRSPDRWNSVPVPERVAQRAYERIDVDENGCWISRYSVASHGYAQIGWQDTKVHMVLAHRAAWVHVNGQMPLGMTLDHLCKTRRCVNPDHLRLLPNYENARRVFGGDWPLGYCANGHPNSARVERMVVSKNGKPRVGSICGLCRPIYLARNNWRTRHPGEPMPEHLLLATEKEVQR